MLNEIFHFWVHCEELGELEEVPIADRSLWEMLWKNKFEVEMSVEYIEKITTTTTNSNIKLLAQYNFHPGVSKEL